MEGSLIRQSKHGIMGDVYDDDHDEIGSMSSSSSSIGDDSTNSSGSSFSSDLMEDATSSSSSSGSLNGRVEEGPLFEMSSLIAQLPIKRGLSKHFDGKSQSFTSLSNVNSLEDLAKPERPIKKRLKACKSYGWGLDSHRSSLSPKDSSRTITKKGNSKGSFSSHNSMAKRPSFLANRPPIPPQRSASQTPLFA